MVKQHQESDDSHATANCESDEKKKHSEASIIEKYLPQQMGEEELTEMISQIIALTQTTSTKDMGKVMAARSKELAGKTNKKMVSRIVKKLL